MVLTTNSNSFVTTRDGYIVPCTMCNISGTVLYGRRWHRSTAAAVDADGAITRKDTGGENALFIWHGMRHMQAGLRLKWIVSVDQYRAETGDHHAGVAILALFDVDNNWHNIPAAHNF